MNDETLRQDDRWEGVRSEGPGVVVGAYTLVRRLGEGGFGDVWEAEQEVPVKRRVALKILKMGMDTREVVARFDLERQALALMEHPHIAHVIDAGATATGRPYFVMEYVEGEPIDAYCASRRMTVAAILPLFVQVCTAVAHAHTKGIIHRDLKPGNVLVGEHDGQPFAKVIDFGIAKATGGGAGERTQATQLHQVVGTPRYMSPEQARGSADIDTRTDVYSLGVIAYELLTGTTPVEREQLAAASLLDTQKLICDIDPPKPSARVLSQATTLTGTATFRPLDPYKLARTIRGDLDWIVMKALEKEPQRRYQGATELAEDLRRFLAGEAVAAAPPSWSYRTSKFVRRNKSMVAAAALAAVSLGAGLVGFAWQAQVAREQAQVARQRADDLQKVADFQAAMFDQLDSAKLARVLGARVKQQYAAGLARTGVPADQRAARIADFAAQWDRVDAAESAIGLVDDAILAPATTGIDRQFKQQPLVAAILLEPLARTYIGMGRPEPALALARQALALRQRELGANDPKTLESLSRLAQLLQAAGKADEAIPLLRRALAEQRRRVGARDEKTLDTLNALGLSLRETGQAKQAEPILRAAVAGRLQVLGPRHKNTFVSMGNLALALEDLGQLDEAETLYRQALEGSLRNFGPDYDQSIIQTNNLGLFMLKRGKPEDAERLMGKAADSARRAWGANHPFTIATLTNLGSLLLVDGKPDAAEPILAEALASSRRVFGDDQFDTLLALDAYAAAQVAKGRFQRGDDLLVPAEVAARKQFTGNQSRRLGQYLTTRGRARSGLGSYRAAERDLLEAEPLLRGTVGADHRDTRICRTALAELYAAWDKAAPGNGHAASAAAWKAKLVAAPTPATRG